MKKLFFLVLSSAFILMGQGNPPNPGNAKKIRGTPVSRAVPSDNFILKYDQAVDSFMFEADQTGAAGGTADSIAVDTDGNGTIDAYLYSTTGAIAMLREGTGMVLTVSEDTVTFATTLGLSISSAEIDDQAITKNDLDTTGSNFPFDGAYHVTSAVPESAYATLQFVRLEIEDSADEYSVTTDLVLRDGSQTMTANWDYGDFDLTGGERLSFDSGHFNILGTANEVNTPLILEADTVKPDVDKQMWLGTVTNKIRMLNLYDFDLYTGGNNGGAYDSSDVPVNGQQLTYLSGTLSWENESILGTSIDGGEIVNQTITKSDIDTTASNFVFDNAYEGTSNVADSQYATRNFVKKELLDSLAEYVLLSGTRAMTGNWSFGDFDLTGGEKISFDTGYVDVLRAVSAANAALTIEADTLKPDVDKQLWIGTLASRVRMLNLYDFDLYTGGNNGGAYDTTDAPSNGQQLTWNTGGTITWEAAGGAGGGDDARVDTSGADDMVNLGSPFYMEQSTGIDLSVGNDTVYFKSTLGTSVDLASAEVTGTLPVENGGTEATTFTAGGMLFGNGTGPITALGVASNGQIAIGDGTTFPVLGTITGTANEIDVTNGAGTITIGLVDPLAVSKGGTGVTDPAIWRTKNNSDTIVYVGADTLLKISRDNQVTDTTTIRPAGSHRLKIEVDNLTIGGQSIIDFQGPGLTVSSNLLSAVLGNNVDLTSEVTGTLPVNNGGTGAASFTDGGIMIGNGSGILQVLGVAANGQIPIGDGTTDPVLATISNGTGTTVVNGAGTIQIDATLGTDVTGSEIVDQTITKADIDTTASNFVFDDAYHVTSNAADSEYASFRYAQARAGDTAAALRNGDTWTGAHDFGGAEIEISNGVNPTTNADGEIAVDTDDDAIEVFDGTQSVLIPLLKTISGVIWDPELVTDTIPIFYCDSTIYQGGITLVSFEAQTNADGAYTLNLYEFDTADPPARVGGSTIATLAFGASDQRDQTTTFSDAGIARGGFVYLLTPATDKTFLRFSLTFRVNDNN